MTKHWRTYAVFGIAVVVIVLLRLTFRSQDTDAREAVLTKQVESTAGEADFSTKRESPQIVRAPDNEASGSKATYTTRSYLRDDNLAALVQAALTSKDPQKLRLAELYIARCEESRVWARGGIDSVASAEKTHKNVSAAINSVRSACNSLSATEENVRLLNAIAASLKSAKTSTCRDGTDCSALDDFSKADSELLYEQLSVAMAKGQSTPFDSMAGCATSDSATDRAVCSLAVLAAICTEKGCDTSFQMARLCGLFQVCEAGSIENQLLEIYKQGKGLAGRFGNVDGEWATLVSQARTILAGRGRL